MTTLLKKDGYSEPPTGSGTVAAYMRPTPSRRHGPGAPAGGRTDAAALLPGQRPTVTDAVEAMLRRHALDWSPTTLRNCRHYLINPSCRFTLWRDEVGIRDLEDLAVERLEGFLADLSSVLSGASVAKYRTYLRALARFCAGTPGYEAIGLTGIERIPRPRQAKYKRPEALGPVDVLRVLDACESTRDRLIVETLLATGVRVSELVALRIDDLHIRDRPPFVVVQRTAHSPDLTKNGRDRTVPLLSAHGGGASEATSLARRLERYIATERDPKRTSPSREVFLSITQKVGPGALPLTVTGVQQLMQRLSERSGVYVHAHKLRHTFATRAVDVGTPIFHLQQFLGHQSIEMVRRYYTADQRAALQSYARLVASSPL